jgi:hypothetical protein
VGLPIDTGNGTGSGASDVGSIAVNGQKIFVGTGEANYSIDSRYGTGIIRSLDGGATWSIAAIGGNDAQTSTAFLKTSISKIIVDPATGNLYAAVVPTDGSTTAVGGAVDPRLGVYKSTDDGTTWQKVSGGLVGPGNLPDGSLVTDLDYTVNGGVFNVVAAVGKINGDPNNGIYLGTPVGNGVNWNRKNAGLTVGQAAGRTSLTSDHASTIYAAISSALSNGQSFLRGVYKSTDNGTTWTNTGAPDFTGGQGFFNLAIGLSPSGRVYVGGVDVPLGNPAQYGLFESNVGATVWRSIDVGPNGIAPHTDQHVFAFTSDGTVYAGNDGGVWRYTPTPLEPGQNVVSGALPTSVVTADFNGDGKVDLAVISAWLDNVEVFAGNGDGTFQVTPVSFPVGKNPHSLVVGDFNRDGWPDLAVANTGDNTVTVMLNNTFGQFPPNLQTIYSAGTGPDSLAVGNFDRRNGPDLAAVDSLAGTVSLLFNNGLGHFDSGATYSVGVGINSIAAGNVDGVNGPDLVVTSTSTNAVMVMLNDGQGNFAPAVPYALPQGANPQASFVADLNRDNKPDLVVANRGTNNVSVFINNGAGAFPLRSDYSAGSMPTDVIVADFDGDGNPDLAVANYGNNSVSVLLATGLGTFLPAVNYAVGLGPASLDAGDFNSDGMPDLAVANSGTTTGIVSILLSTRLVPPRGTGNWDDLNTAGLNTNQLEGVAINPSNQNVLLEGSQDNGHARGITAGGVTTWTTTGWADGGLVRFDNTGAFAYKMTQNGALWRSADAGNPANGNPTWTPKFVAPQGTAPFYSVFAVANADPTRLIFGMNASVMEGRNRGDSWSQIGGSANFNDNTGVSALAYAPSNANVIYVGFNDGKLFETSNDGGGQWQVPRANPPLWLANKISGFAINPQNANDAYLTIAQFEVGHVFHTTDGGLTWTDISFNLPDVPANAVVLDSSGASPVLYVGNDAGVYQGTVVAAGQWNWARYGTGFPNVQVLDLQLQSFGASTFLLAATHGRGAWIIDPPSGQALGDDQGGDDGLQLPGGFPLSDAVSVQRGLGQGRSDAQAQLARELVLAVLGQSATPRWQPGGQ